MRPTRYQTYCPPGAPDYMQPHVHPTGPPSYMIPVGPAPPAPQPQRQYRPYRRAGFGWISRFFAIFCGLSIRFLLVAIVIVNLAIASILIQRFTTIDGVTIPNASPPSSVIFSEVVSAISLAYVLLSFCFYSVPILMLVGDTIAFVAWFAAAIILGVALNQSLRYSCQALAIALSVAGGGYGGIIGGVTSAVGVGVGVGAGFGGVVGGYGVAQGTGGYGIGGGFGGSTLAQQIFDSCNISKTLFAFHVIAAALFIGTAANAAIQASSGGGHSGAGFSYRREGRAARQVQQPQAQQQSSYYGRGMTDGYRSQKGGTAVPEIVV